MADRYWVGNGGTWTDTNKWSETDGGASGASVPGINDNAIFTANSFSSNFQLINGGSTINVGGLDTTGVTNAPTLSVAHLKCGRDCILSGFTYSGCNFFSFNNVADGDTVVFNVESDYVLAISNFITNVVSTESYTVDLACDMYNPGLTISLYNSGAFNTNGYDLTIKNLWSFLNYPSVSLGDSIIELTTNVSAGTKVWWNVNLVDGGTSKVIIGNAGGNSVVVDSTLFNADFNILEIEEDCTILGEITVANFKTYIQNLLSTLTIKIQGPINVNDLTIPSPGNFGYTILEPYTPATPYTFTLIGPTRQITQANISYLDNSAGSTLYVYPDGTDLGDNDNVVFLEMPPTVGFNIFLGDTQIDKIYLGETEVTDAFLGSDSLK